MFGAAQRSGADAFVRVIHRSGIRRPVERAAAVERPQRVEAAQGIRSTQRKFAERGRDLRIAPLDQQPLRGQPVPAIRVAEQLHKFGGRGTGKPRRLAIDRLVFRDDAPDATEVVAFVEMPFPDLFRQPRHHENDVLDDAVIEVGDVERTIRADARIDRTEAFVGRGEKLLLRGMETRCHGRDATAELEPAEQMPAGLGDKDIAARIGGKLVPVVAANAGRDGVGAQPPVVAKFERAERDGRRHANGKNFRRPAGDVHVHPEQAAITTATLRGFEEIPVP